MHIHQVYFLLLYLDSLQGLTQNAAMIRYCNDEGLYN